MSKKLILVFLAGWLLSLVVSPSLVVGIFKGVTSRAS